MIIVSTKGFEKEFSKLHHKVRSVLLIKIKIFAVNPFEHSLHNHKLKGELKHYRSINITGDYRVIYEQLNNETVRLIRIGTHSDLYGK